MGDFSSGLLPSLFPTLALFILLPESLFTSLRNRYSHAPEYSLDHRSRSAHPSHVLRDDWRADSQWLLGYNFSVSVWVGYIVALFGIAVETGVVMVVYLHEALEKRFVSAAPLTHEDIHEAVIEGAVQRLRPKLMTVSAVVASLVPILWESGIGSDVMKPIAAPIVGGMITSTIHVLIIVPVFS